MIVKSISRKTPSFGQLVRYMTRAGSSRDYDLYHHLVGQSPLTVAAEFARNAVTLNTRRNGNMLYHEILSIDTRACGQGDAIKDALRRVAVAYVAARCPNCLAYGVLHDDHDGHLHYHLMISANARGEHKRFRLTRADFAKVKRQIEALTRTHFPELKQDVVMGKEVAQSEGAQKNDALRVKKKEKAQPAPQESTRDVLAGRICEMMAAANSQDEFEALLAEMGYAFYTRGKHYGVKDAVSPEGKKTRSYRFAAL